MRWIDKNFKGVKTLTNRILQHRRKCNHWKNANPCFDCHLDTIGKIDEELRIIWLKFDNKTIKHLGVSPSRKKPLKPQKL